MPIFNCWQSGSAALIALGLAVGAVAPLVKSAPSFAQSFNIKSGTSISVKYEQAERILVTKEEIAPLTLNVAKDVMSPEGTLLIPAGSQIFGELRPTEGGCQFVARELILSTGQRYQINASSGVITKTEQIRKGTNAATVVGNAALGTGAAAAIFAVTGDRNIKLKPTLGGTSIGALVGLFLGRESIDLIAIDPATDLQLTLGLNLLLSQRQNMQ